MFNPPNVHLQFRFACPDFLREYDHHARYYDAEIGRWWAIDPVLQCASPYMAMGNNPMMFTDADGKTWNPSLPQESFLVACRKIKHSKVQKF
ncbi:RHS repeat domain-containing protein [Marinifilum sp. RC60d5]|uniref:RHS repeat domain-containing protein n=1 Tax=Marinifilum sp. RC60d5 TaxID=3458414 RepID=UPI004035C031